MDYKTSVQGLAICIADRDAVALWGPAGNGKTSTVQKIASTYNLHLETVIASVREPSDFAGMPHIKDGVMHLAPPAWGQRLVDAASGADGKGPRAGIAFYDEISTAPPSTQAALLRPILEGVLGDLELPKTTRTIAAANFPDTAADGWDLAAPVANRFIHLDWVLDAPAVKKGFTTGWEDVEIPSFPNDRNMTRARARSLALVGIFLGTRPNLVNGNMKDHATGSAKYEASDYAFPSPRSWETAARLHAVCSVARLANGRKISDGVLPLLLKGTVGPGAAAEFITFIRALDLPDANDLLNGKIEFIVPPRGDQLEAICSGILYSYSTHPSPERWTRWGNILTAIVESKKADAAYRYVQDWNSLRPTGVIPTREQTNAFSKILDVLES